MRRWRTRSAIRCVGGTLPAPYQHPTSTMVRVHPPVPAPYLEEIPAMFRRDIREGTENKGREKRRRGLRIGVNAELVSARLLIKCQSRIAPAQSRLNANPSRPQHALGGTCRIGIDRLTVHALLG